LLRQQIHELANADHIGIDIRRGRQLPCRITLSATITVPARDNGKHKRK
jgi:hypothetical protein